MEKAFYDGSYRKKRRVILTNDKHNTSISLMCRPNVALTYNQTKRAREQLCGILGCDCHKALGIHGPQAYDIIHVGGEGWMIRSNQYSLF